jgi:hypothetical protein
VDPRALVVNALELGSAADAFGRRNSLSGQGQLPTVYRNAFTAFLQDLSARRRPSGAFGPCSAAA